jgi:type I restriction enzyme M protein
MDATEYKHLVLGLIFLKYISDTFAAQQSKLLLMVSDPDSDNYIGDEPADHQASLDAAIARNLALLGFGAE